MATKIDWAGFGKKVTAVFKFFEENSSTIVSRVTAIAAGFDVLNIAKIATDIGAAVTAGTALPGLIGTIGALFTATGPVGIIIAAIAANNRFILIRSFLTERRCPPVCGRTAYKIGATLSGRPGRVGYLSRTISSFSWVGVSPAAIFAL